MRTVGLAKDCAQQQKWVRLPGLSLGGGSRDGSARPSPRCGRRVCRAPWTRTTGCRTCRRAQLSTRTLRSGTRLGLVTVSG